MHQTWRHFNLYCCASIQSTYWRTSANWNRPSIQIDHIDHNEYKWPSSLVEQHEFIYSNYGTGLAEVEIDLHWIQYFHFFVNCKMMDALACLPDRLLAIKHYYQWLIDRLEHTQRSDWPENVQSIFGRPCSMLPVNPVNTWPDVPCDMILISMVRAHHHRQQSPWQIHPTAMVHASKEPTLNRNRDID